MDEQLTFSRAALAITKYDNPCKVLLEEAQRQCPGRGQMRALSIGTGLGDVVTIKDAKMIDSQSALGRLLRPQKRSQ